MDEVDAAGLPVGDGHPPRVMGVLNVSEESPYDPSVYHDPGEAAAYVDGVLLAEGADLVDVGLESANKRFEVLSAEEELARLDAAVEVVESVSGDAVFSIETRYADVADEALSRGFDVVNDVCGFADPRMPAVCREHDAAVVKMASPPDLQRPGAVDDVDWAARKGEAWADEADYVDELYEALKREGFTDDTIVDPAFGGWSERKTLEDDRETLRRLREFRGLGRPVLVSINRKNFLRSIADRATEAALPASLAATSMAVERGAHVVRTHDVAETRDAVLVGRAFARRQGRHVDDVRVEELDVTTAAEAGRHLERLDADGAAADDAAVLVFEVGGLSRAAEAALERAARSAGATYASGSEPGSGLLVGTRRALSAVRGALHGGDDQLRAIRNLLPPGRG